MKKTERLYYIQNGYVGNAVLWWAVDSRGYTTEIDKAGKYTHEEVKRIIQRPEDSAWLCSYIDKNIAARKTVIDMQYLSSKGHRLVGKRR